MPFYTSNKLTLGVVSLLFFGCAGADSPATGGTQSSSTADTSVPAPSLPPAAPSAYRLPWTCGHQYVVTQGNHGDECGILGNHTGVEEYAWDFGLPMRTPVVAVRAGIVTLAAELSPPGSACYGGCPNAKGGANLEQQACCSACLFVSNKVSVLHEDGAISSYSHLDEIVVSIGEVVRAGQMLGYSGTSGCSTGPHLHFQIMSGCPGGYCQSLPIRFDEAGVPACGSKPVSANNCG